MSIHMLFLALLAVFQGAQAVYHPSLYHEREAYPRHILLEQTLIDTRVHKSFDQEPALQSLSHDELFLVQLTEVNEVNKAAVEALAQQPLDQYVPHHAYLIRTSFDRARQIKNLPTVTWVGYYHPQYRVHNSLRETVVNSDPRAKRCSTPQCVRRQTEAFAARGATTPAADADVLSEDERDYQDLIKVQLARFVPPLSREQLAELAKQLTSGLAEATSLEGHATAEHITTCARPGTFTLSYADDAYWSIAFCSQDDMLKTVDWLSARHQIQFIERRPVFRTLNKYARTIMQIGSESGDRTASLSERYGLFGEGQVIGVGDSGSDSNNCMLYDPDQTIDSTRVTWQTTVPSGLVPNPSHRKYMHYVTFADNRDDNGHGTHVSGSLAGYPYTDSVNSQYFSWAAQAGKAKLAFFDIGTGTTGSLSVPNNLNSQYLPYAYAAGARIHSNSWGSSSNTYTTDDQQMDQFIAANQDMLVLVAAGNAGSVQNTVGSPGVAKNIISVGAAFNCMAFYQEMMQQVPSIVSGVFNYVSNNPTRYSSNSMAFFSSVGPTADRRIKPDLVAPGMGIFSALNNQNPQTSCKGALSASLTEEEGTSMATPTLASTATLLREYFVKGFYPAGVSGACQSVSPSAALLKSLLMSSAVPMTGFQDQSPTNGAPTQNFRSIAPESQFGFPNIIQGFGRPKLDNVLFFPGDDLNTLVFRQPTSLPQHFGDPALATGGSHTYTMTLSKAADVCITLVWTDPASTSGTGAKLVNDLDLTIVAPDQTKTIGNNKVAPTFSGVSTRVPATQYDRTNNAEQIRLTAAAAGTYTITVTAALVSVGSPQSYALTAIGSGIDYGAASLNAFIPCDATSGQATTRLVTGVSVGIGLFFLLLLIAYVIIHERRRRRKGASPSNRSQAAPVNYAASARPAVAQQQQPWQQAAYGGAVVTAASARTTPSANRVAPPPPRQPQGLPPGWGKYYDENTGAYYYFNQLTGATQWEMPTA